MTLFFFSIIKATNYPHHEGIWGWGDCADQVVLVVSDVSRVLIQYHDILWDIGYAQTWEEAYERIENLYKQTEEEGNENPPVADFLVWRNLRVFDGKFQSHSSKKRPCYIHIQQF